MQNPSEISDVIAYFMTEYASDSAPAILEEVMREVLERTLRPERAADLVDKFLPSVQAFLVTEFNERYGSGKSLRFRLLDDEGSKISGIGDLAEVERLEFQDAINTISHSQFEGLSALVLKEAGCRFLRRTPESHDQGIDAFGHMEFYEKFPISKSSQTCRVVFLAQAKHYSQCKVGSKDVREFVGSATLALHKIYSTVDVRYTELEILPFSPTSLVFVTSEEIPGTVRRLAQRTGIIVFTSDDLFDLFVGHLAKKPPRIDSAWLKQQWQSDIDQIPVAK